MGLSKEMCSKKNIAAHPSAENQAHVHQRVRRQHAEELAQDYVEAIYTILETDSLVKISDLQEIFGVSHVTVIRTLQRLQEQELVDDTRSKKIGLTQKGRELAERAAARHQLLTEFLVALGVSERQADADAEGAEHHLSDETMAAIRAFLKERT